MLFIYVHAFISRHVKMIQNDLLYNKIECYNKAVQRKLNIKKEPLLTKSSGVIEVFLFMSRHLSPGM